MSASIGDGTVFRYDLPYFYHAFFIMPGICVVCYFVLMLCSVDLVLSRLRCARLFTLVSLFEVVYFFAVGSFWLESTFEGHSWHSALGEHEVVELSGRRFPFTRAGLLDDSVEFLGGAGW